MGQLDGKVAIVTGGGAGIGRAAVLRFADEGARVVVNDRIAARVDETVALVRDQGGQAVGMTADVTDSDAVASLVDLAAEQFGALDVMFANAGTGLSQGPIATVGDGGWNKDVSLNLTSMFYCVRESLRVMVPAGRGSIVCTSSASAVRAVPGTGAYASAKAAVLALVRSAAIESGPNGVRVNAIIPGTVATDALLGWAQADSETLSHQEAATPLGRMGRPEELAAAALWLAGDESSFVTGTSILVDGGSSAGRG